MFLQYNPVTGDAGINPVVLILFILCAVIIVCCLLWAFVINRKNSKVKTTVITLDANDTPPTTDINNSKLDSDNNSTNE